MRTSIVLLAVLICVDALRTMPPTTSTRGAHPFIAGAVSNTPPRVATPNNAHPSRTIVPRLNLLTTASSAVLGAASFVARLPAPILLSLAVVSEIGGTAL